MRGPISRGILPLAYLCSTKFDQEWDKELDSSFSATETGKLDLSRIGGFTLVHGHLKIDPVSKRIEGLNIISNRGDKGRILVPKGTSSDTSEDNKSWVHSKGEQSLNDDIEHKSTFGLSNSLFNHPWSKVTLGESLLDDLVDKALAKGMTEDDLVSGCFDLLSHDTYPKELLHEPNFEKKFNALRYSIFIPPLKTGMLPDSQDTTMGSLYGTRMQTVILLNKNGDLKYYERDLHLSDIMDQLKVSTLSFEFNIA
ncbi:uncharacterized protein PRCAT00005864001 [Priceomyces carsonii]|uniref:uncharacterized protein n=1 Tax=Priceomyces carsonii TaxID=28549 RepID=UPI002EDB76D3|nr:unnamed protein product [Priceomyces carsonii]